MAILVVDCARKFLNMLLEPEEPPIKIKQVKKRLPKKKKKVKAKKKRSRKVNGFAKHKNQTRKEYYRKYIKSKMWFAKRKLIIKRDKGKCVVCEDKARDVHHWVYPKVLGTEKLSTLDSVCRECHDEMHTTYKVELDKIHRNGKLFHPIRKGVIGSIQERLSYEMVDEEYIRHMADY